MEEQNYYAKQKHYARPDKPDPRDWIFKSTLFDTPQKINLEEYIKNGIPVLDQTGEGEGACTGFALATVCHYLLRTREVQPDETEVSARMLYKMAKRSSEWLGEGHKGYSARCAIKGWYNHGVCSKEKWNESYERGKIRFTDDLAKESAKRPLGAYYRVNKKNRSAMHAAVAEVGVLYATAILHSGWHNVGKDGIIKFDGEKTLPDAHAFVIVAYDEHGFWIQNSFGAGWGKKGFAHISYIDWLKNGMDVWVIQFGAPLAIPPDGWQDWVMHDDSITFVNLRKHIISIGNNGLPNERGQYGTNPSDIEEILTQDFPVTTLNWEKKRIMLYAHGGLTSQEDAIKWVHDNRNRFLSKKIYPLIFAWNTDFLSLIKDELEDILGGVPIPPPASGDTPPFPGWNCLPTWWDSVLEWSLRNIPSAHNGFGKSIWEQVRENALLATQNPQGGARLVLEHLNTLMGQDSSIEVHIVGYSAGGVFQAPLVQKLSTEGQIDAGPMQGEDGHGRKIKTCTLWAPACTTDLFKSTYFKVIEPGGKLDKFALFTLFDVKEREDNIGDMYSKSVMYLVSNALEQPGYRTCPDIQDGEALLGMEKCLLNSIDTDIHDLFILQNKPNVEWVKTPDPNGLPENDPNASGAEHHLDFDNDKKTLQATIARILAP